MFDGIPLQLITGGGWFSLFAFFAFLMMTGKIVSKGTCDDRVGDKQDQITYLRATLELRDQEVRIRTEQVQKLLSNSDLTVQLLQALGREVTRGDLAP